MEEWKTILGFENYEVSNYGNVKKKECSIIYKNGAKTFYKEKILKQESNRQNSHGTYKRVTLSQNNIQRRFQVHRLVCEYFTLNPLNKPCVNHIDGDPSNNNILNLEWVTYSENERHSYDVLGKVNANKKLSNNAVLDILSNAVKGVNHAKKGNVILFMIKYKVDRTTILNVLNKKYYV